MDSAAEWRHVLTAEFGRRYHRLIDGSAVTMYIVMRQLAPTQVAFTRRMACNFSRAHLPCLAKN